MIQAKEISNRMNVILKIYKCTHVYILATFIIFVWSSTFICIKINLHGLDSNGKSYDTFSPGALALLRGLAASIVLLLLFLFNRTKISMNKFNVRDSFLFIIMGLCGFSIYNLLLNSCALKLQPGVIGFIVGQTPLLVTIISTFVLKKSIGYLQIFSIMIGVTGLITILVSQPILHSNYSGLILVIMLLVSGVIFNFLQTDHILHKYSATEIISYATWFSLPILLPYTFELLNEIKNVSTSNTVIAIYSGIFPGALAYVLWVKLLNKISIVQLSLLLYMLPLVSAILSYFVLHERYHWLFIVGALLAFLSGMSFNLNIRR